jgi:hypothetical protein
LKLGKGIVVARELWKNLNESDRRAIDCIAETSIGTAMRKKGKRGRASLWEYEVFEMTTDLEAQEIPGYSTGTWAFKVLFCTHLQPCR